MMGWSYRVVVEDAVHLAAGWVAAWLNLYRLWLSKGTHMLIQFKNSAYMIDRYQRGVRACSQSGAAVRRKSGDDINS